jgi:hypothetical protein
VRGHFYTALLFMVISTSAAVAPESSPTISVGPEQHLINRGQPVTAQFDCRPNEKDNEIPDPLPLEAVLKKESGRYLRLGRRDYYFAYALVAVTIVSSAVAGVAAIISKLPRLAVGILALVPSVSYTAGTVLKPQGRANWHYRKAQRIEALCYKLVYENVDPGKISEEKRAIEVEMNKQWEGSFGLEPSFLPGAPRTEP